ncbi:MAG: signal peptidase II [Desulfosarcina sp.]
MNSDPGSVSSGSPPDKPLKMAKHQNPPPSMGMKAFLAIAGVVVLLDQISKLLVLREIGLYHSITVIPGFFNLTHVRNPGGAFSFMATGSPGLRNLLFVGVSTLAMALIVYFYRSTPKSHPALAAALAMIFGGAVGNLIDRLRFGEVVDFLDVYLGPYHWPTFNVADSAITVGITIFIAHVVLGKMPD